MTQAASFSLPPQRSPADRGMDKHTPPTAAYPTGSPLSLFKPVTGSESATSRRGTSAGATAFPSAICKEVFLLLHQSCCLGPIGWELPSVYCSCSGAEHKELSYAGGAGRTQQGPDAQPLNWDKSKGHLPRLEGAGLNLSLRLIIKHNTDLAHHTSSVNKPILSITVSFLDNECPFPENRTLKSLAL